MITDGATDNFKPLIGIKTWLYNRGLVETSIFRKCTAKVALRPRLGFNDARMNDILGVI